ncbi:MAG: PadR family transcriptional regulator [Nocardiopsaceae bacterium]|nr:PadR family transcriptional regulator [Nocardiopsaceae bacterium]
MNSTRLFILGSLARGGDMYGHQIRRAAQVDRTELWTDIKQGSLYSALHRMTAEGVIAIVRTEREGNLPARTIYTITPAGREELAALRDEALRQIRLRPDPVDLALQNAQDMPEDELRAVLDNRRAALAAELASWRHLRDTAGPHLTGIEALGFSHTLLRLEAEVTWHEECLKALPAIFAAPDTGTA